MKLSLNIILDDLSYCNPVCYIKDRTITFKSTSLITPNPEDRTPDRLVVCKLSDALKYRTSESNCYIAAVIDTELPKDASLLRSMVLFDTNLSAVEFFNKVQGVFEKYSDWCSEMDQYLIKRRSIQDLISLSEGVIGNFITISDSSFTLVAYTQGLPCTDPISSRLIEKGYHDQEAINLFSKNNLMDYWRDEVDIYERDQSITGYPMLGKIIHYNNTYFSHVVMICNNRLPSPALKDIFQMLVDRLMVCFERQWLENNQMPHIYDNLLLEMLNPNELTQETINARAKNAGIPVSGNFVLIKVSTEDSTGIMLQRLCQELSSKIASSRVTLSKDILVALITNGKNTSNASVIKDLEDIMEKFSSGCGISDSFTNLSDIRVAGEQAEIALKFVISKKCSGYHPGTKKQRSRVMSFSECYPKYLITADPEVAHIAKSAKASKALKILDDYDTKHGTNNLELLYTYLTNERRASDTALIMHMHRNNVIYRVGKISEMIDLDLDDFAVRFRLLIAYVIFSSKDTL